MDHLEGAGSERGDRVGFDPRVRLEFRGTRVSSEYGLLVMRELDNAPGMPHQASMALSDNRRGKSMVHRLDGLFRQSVYGRLAGHEDVNAADRLALDPVMRQIVGGRAVDAQAASASQKGRFETETLALPENREALAGMTGVHGAICPTPGVSATTVTARSDKSLISGQFQATLLSGYRLLGECRFMCIGKAQATTATCGPRPLSLPPAEIS